MYTPNAGDAWILLLMKITSLRFYIISWHMYCSFLMLRLF